MFQYQSLEDPLRKLSLIKSTAAPHFSPLNQYMKTFLPIAQHLIFFGKLLWENCCEENKQAIPFLMDSQLILPGYTKQGFFYWPS